MAGFREKVWIIIAVFLAASLITGIVFLSIRLGQLRPVEIDIQSIKRPDVSGDVNICGAIACPGIYTVEAGDTLTSLLSAAGLSDNADTSHIKIYVPATGELNQPQRVDLNRAEIWLIQALPGIGEGRAKLIVDYRQKNGPFRKVDDLLKIEGLGDSIFEKVKNLVTVGD